jgi:hypothetical protein
VAEALVELDDPLAALLPREPIIPPTPLVRGMLAALLPAEARAPVPEWLWPGQAASFRRALAALARYDGALLADPAGSGKTWIALAVARALGRGATVVAPAGVAPAWREAARRTAVAIEVCSHERASRGRLPPRPVGLVIVDESHRFREPGTRRYRHLAPWLGRAPVLLLTATPVVNRLPDLTHQLLLALRDDALLASGCASLRAALARGEAPACLGEVVLCRPDPAGLPALRRRRLSLPFTPEDRGLLEQLCRLRLSRDAGVRTLLRGAICAAFASSPAALAATLKRYQRLLSQATEAAAAGRCLTRRELREAAGRDQEQLVLWGVLPEGDQPLELALEDAPVVAELLQRSLLELPYAMARLATLEGVIRDRCPTVVFTGSRTTLGWLRDRLAALRPAWVSGSGAGIGPASRSRAEVLALFGPDAPARLPGELPALLLATDVAAEGLNLQRARRVVHFDLPWTAVRLTQRAGRVRRLRSAAPVVEVVTFAPPRELERVERRVARLLGKSRLPAAAGLEDRGSWLHRWRGELAPLAEGEQRSGIVAVAGAEPGWILCLSLRREGEPGPPRPARLCWIGDDGVRNERPSEVLPRLLDALHAEGRALAPEAWATLPLTVTPLLREALAALHGRAWEAVARPRDQRRLAQRLVRLASLAARARNRDALLLLDRGLRWLAHGLRAGEELLASHLLGLPRRELLGALRELPPEPAPPGAALPRVAGIVRVTSFLP